MNAPSLTPDQLQAIKRTAPWFDPARFYSKLSELDPVTHDLVFEGEDRQSVFERLSTDLQAVVFSVDDPGTDLVKLQCESFSIEPELSRQALLHALQLQSVSDTIAWDTLIRGVFAQELGALDVHLKQDEPPSQPASDSLRLPDASDLHARSDGGSEDQGERF